MTAPRDRPDLFAIVEIALRSLASRLTESVIAASSDGLFLGLVFEFPFELALFAIVVPIRFVGFVSCARELSCELDRDSRLNDFARP